MKLTSVVLVGVCGTQGPWVRCGEVWFESGGAGGGGDRCMAAWMMCRVAADLNADSCPNSHNSPRDTQAEILPFAMLLGTVFSYLAMVRFHSCCGVW